jgi:hypothetical protein
MRFAAETIPLYSARTSYVPQPQCVRDAEAVFQKSSRCDLRSLVPLRVVPGATYSTRRFAWACRGWALLGTCVICSVGGDALAAGCTGYGRGVCMGDLWLTVDGLARREQLSKRNILAHTCAAHHPPAAPLRFSAWAGSLRVPSSLLGAATRAL